jgi:hypothetical protein
MKLQVGWLPFRLIFTPCTFRMQVMRVTNGITCLGPNLKSSGVGAPRVLNLNTRQR